VKRLLLIALPAVGLLVLPFAGCDQSEFSTTIVTAQVVKTLGIESNTASVLIGKATVANLFNYEWMETPDPGDSNFVNYIFPARIEPIGGATCTVNSTNVGQTLPGIYFRAALDLHYLERCDLDITLPSGGTVTAHGFLPDSFSILAPRQFDTVSQGATLTAAWTRSDSAETYLVGISPADTASPARGWTDGRTDTSCVIPASAFEDTLGNFVPGVYTFGVTAINGGWNKSALDLFLSGGNLEGAKGTFGCAVYPLPVVVIAE